MEHLQVTTSFSDNLLRIISEREREQKLIITTEDGGTRKQFDQPDTLSHKTPPTGDMCLA
jgi:hypothetical protein